LTNFERADFYGRHPVVAQKINLTLAQMATGLYDFNANPASWSFPQLIPPWGVAVLDDLNYGNVVIFPARDGSIRLSGFVPSNNLGNINDPAYIAEGSTLPDVMHDISTAVTSVLIPLAFVVVAYFAFQARKK
jgi:hypothetical protein